MAQILRRLVLTSLALFVFAPGLAAADSSSNSSDGPPIDVMGKVADHNYVDLPGDFDIHLPRIILADGNWYFYANTESALESGDFVEENHALVPVAGGTITLDLSITSHLVYFWVAIILTIWMTRSAASKYRSGVGRETEPQGTFMNIFEVFFVFTRDEIAKNYIPENKYERFLPYLFGVFIAISLMNLFGLLPWGVTATADLTVTATLAFITFVITQASGTKDHWEHVFMFPGVPAWVRFILTPVEILGLFTKPFALAIRLFANMLSGKIMIICILGLIFIFTDIFGTGVGLGTSPFWVLLTAGLYFLKAFVALLQAYIFTLLSAVFIGMAAEEHEHEEGHIPGHA